MRIERALQELKEGTCYECAYGCESTASCEASDCPFSVAMKMAIESVELLSHITDRPCEACEFKVDGHCTKWDCVFDDYLHKYVYGKGRQE